jgi:hypothetical protein
MQKLLRIISSLLIIAFLSLPLLLPIQQVQAAPPEILVGYTQGDLPSGFPLNLTTHVIIEYLTPATYSDMT